MAKRKKKPSQHQQQKLAEARRRNEFLYKLNYLITALTGDPSVFKLIPHSEYDILLAFQMYSPRVTIAPGHTVPKQVYNDIKEFVNWGLKANTFPIIENGPVVTFHLFLTIGLTLMRYINALEEYEYPTAKTVKEALANIVKTGDFNLWVALKRFNDVAKDTLISKLPLRVNNYREAIYWVDYDLFPLEEESTSSKFCVFRVSSYRPKIMNIIVEDKVRPAYEVCWGFTGLGAEKVTFDPAKLGLSANDHPAPLPVYIQSHALNRIYERTDCMRDFVITNCIFGSLYEGDFTRNGKNSYLLPLIMLNKKVGYLVASVYQNVILVKTFLFITNNGTPEGNMLATLTKLNKLDKAYLAIDKLSTFYASDIADNPEVKKLFIEAGCADLFDLDPIFLQKGTTEQKKPLADKILNYLNLTTSDDNMETYRKEQMPV